MKAKLKPLTRETKKEVVNLIRVALKKYNAGNPPDYAKEVINTQSENIRLAADAFDYGSLQMIIDYRFSIEVVMLILEIEALAPDELRELKEKILPLVVRKKWF